jgi:hypothetical protein
MRKEEKTAWTTSTFSGFEYALSVVFRLKTRVEISKLILKKFFEHIFEQINSVTSDLYVLFYNNLFLFGLDNFISSS